MQNPISTAQKPNQSWRALLLLLSVVCVLSLLFLVNSLLKVTSYLQDVNRLEVASATIVNSLNDAVYSRDPQMSARAYQALGSEMNNYENALGEVVKAGMGGGFAGLQSTWQTAKPKIAFVIEHKNDVDVLADLNKQIDNAAARMQMMYSEASKQVGANPNALAGIQEQMLRLERLKQAMHKISTSADGSFDDIKTIATQIERTLSEQNSSINLPIITQIKSVHDEMIKPVSSQIQGGNNPAISARENASSLSRLAEETQSQLAGVNRSIVGQPAVWLPALVFLLSLLGALWAFNKYMQSRVLSARHLIEVENLRYRQELATQQERASQIEEENQRNQTAILRLLDELADLAEGDLTVNATVSEDFTGAIADSINFAIDQMRNLVLAINTTADRVAQSSEQTQMTAVELAESSEHQAQEIAGVSAAINQMAVSIDQVSTNATESAAVAQRSVAIAHNGAEVVQRTIMGMNTIREQIQETSKRIKRLGESSQEIGDIVSLINDIADQTNILALNAAIQASMAGEAGRGFAVVADEVQRLAERSAAATRQIETLVKTIQADTNEAVASMESTTTEVVKGANLAKDAGEALEEVQSVSFTLADLIQSISNAAQQQAASAGHISNTMNVIQDITSQTSSGTLATARSVGRLSEMAVELQKSVSGFRLSNDH